MGFEWQKDIGAYSNLYRKNLLKYLVDFNDLNYTFNWSLIFVKGSLELIAVRMHVSVCAHGCIAAGFLQSW